MSSSTSCLTHERLRQLSQNELCPREMQELDAHVTHCGACRRILEEAGAEPDWQQELRSALSDRSDPHAFPACANSSAEDAPHDADGSVEHFVKLLGPTDDPRMLGRIGPYEIVGILGRGGMGVVFKGFDAALNRYVAIKMLLPHLATSGAARKRFAREAQAAAAVVDDHVMAIHSVAEWQGVPYLVMPYGRGVSLQKRINDEGPLEVREILRIAMQAAAGLAAAHAQGLVHRDVKPANILLAQGVERVTLTDFGLARAVDDASLTRIGVLAGTPQYMSPEQARANSVDARSDLFSLGSVLYAMCTGQPPFRSDSTYGLLRLITDDEPRPIREINPEIPAWLCAIVTKLMQKRPEDRYSTAREVAELLEGCLAHIQQPTAVDLPTALIRPTPASVSTTLTRRFKGVVVMLATVVLSLAALFAWQSTNPPDIGGEWSGENWGQVVLQRNDGGEYHGTFTETVGKEAGTIQLKWSRIERRFNGNWNDGEDRFGNLSLRLVDNEIRGAWTTDARSRVNPATPALADFSWARITNRDAARSKGEGKHRTPQEALRAALIGRRPDVDSVPQTAGIGLALAQQDGQIVVGTVLPNTPADRSRQLRPGDLIVRIVDGDRSIGESETPQQWTLNKVVEFLRGPANTSVKLFVIRGGKAADKRPDERFELTLIRERSALIEAGDVGQLKSDVPATPQPKPPAAGSGTGTIKGTLLDKSGTERVAVLTPRQIVENGEKLYHSRERIAVQFQVVSAKPIVVADEKGIKHEHYNLYAEDVPAFSVRLTDKAKDWLKIREVADVHRVFVGKWIRVEGTVYGVGLDLIYRPTQWTYHLDLHSLDQLTEVEPAALKARAERLREELRELDPFADSPARPAAPAAEKPAAAPGEKPAAQEKPAVEEERSPHQ